MKKILAIIATVVIFFGLAGLISGCQEKAKSTEQVVMADGSIKEFNKEDVVIENTTPKTYSYEGPKYTNKGSYFDFMHLFGDGVVAAAASHKAAQIGKEDIPGINMDDITVSKGGVGKSTMGADEIGIMARIWTKIKDLGIWIAFGVVAFIVLPIFFPVLKPIFASLWAVIKKIFTTLFSALPVVGAFVASHFASQATVASTANTEIVSADENFKEAVNKSTLLTPEAKTYVIELFRTAHVETHSDDTNKIVENITK